MSATEKRFRRYLKTRVAKHEMKEALADGRLKFPVPARVAVHELERALGERRKLIARLAEVQG